MQLQFFYNCSNFRNLKTLSIVYAKSQSNTALDILELLVNELLIPLGNDYKYVMSSEGDSEDLEVAYAFVHDRIQQAAYSFYASSEYA